MKSLLSFCLLISSFNLFSIRQVNLASLVPRDTHKRPGSLPYISGDSIRLVADHIYDETDSLFKASKIKYADIVFVNIALIGEFFRNEHPNIQSPYILITHNYNISAPGTYEFMLKDPKILKWFGSNPSINKNKKFQGLPLGLPNPHWPKGQPTIFNKMRNRIKNIKKEYLLIMNFNVNTCPERRQHVYELFSKRNFCKNMINNGIKSHEVFLTDTAKARFVLSPFGSGYDCHRTWEILLMNSIPIVLSSPLDQLYKNLPVLIVNKWEEVTTDLLNNKYLEFKARQYKLEKMFCNYWLNKIKKFQNLCKRNKY